MNASAKLDPRRRRFADARSGLWYGVVVGQQRLGIGLVSLIATLREAGRLPVRTIQWYLDNEPWWRAILERGYQAARLGGKAEG